MLPSGLTWADRLTSPPWWWDCQTNQGTKGRSAHNRFHQARGLGRPRGLSTDGPQQPRSNAKLARGNSRGLLTSGLLGISFRW
jgi:hypothetical protein